MTLDPEPRKSKDGRRADRGRSERGNWREDARVDRERREVRERENKERREHRGEHSDAKASPRQTKGI